MSSDKNTSVRTEATQARAGVAVGGLWRSGRAMVAMAALLMMVLTFAGVRPTESEASVGWCKRCYTAETAAYLADAQISLPQAAETELPGSANVYIPVVDGYAVGVDFRASAPVDALSAKANALRLVAPR
jgi:hypothetical protein